MIYFEKKKNGIEMYVMQFARINLCALSHYFSAFVIPNVDKVQYENIPQQNQRTRVCCKLQAVFQCFIYDFRAPLTVPVDVSHYPSCLRLVALYSFGGCGVSGRYDRLASHFSKTKPFLISRFSKICVAKRGD